MGAIRTTHPLPRLAIRFAAPRLRSLFPETVHISTIRGSGWVAVRHDPPATAGGTDRWAVGNQDHPTGQSSLPRNIREYCAVCDQFIWRAQQSTINACATLLLIAYRSSLIADCLSLIPAHDKVSALSAEVAVAFVRSIGRWTMTALVVNS